MLKTPFLNNKNSLLKSLLENLTVLTNCFLSFHQTSLVILLQHKHLYSIKSSLNLIESQSLCIEKSTHKICI